MLSAKKRKSAEPRLSIRVDQDVYLKLKELKQTERGLVSFSGVLRWLLEKAGH